MKTNHIGGASAGSDDPWECLGTGCWFRKVCVTVFSFLGAAQRIRALVCSWVCQSFDTVLSKKLLNLLA